MNRRFQNDRLVSIFLICINLFNEADLNFTSIVIQGSDRLRQLEVAESCSHAEPYVVELFQRKLVKHEKIDVQIPAELIFEDAKLFSVDDI